MNFIWARASLIILEVVFLFKPFWIVNTKQYKTRQNLYFLTLIFYLYNKSQVSVFLSFCLYVCISVCLSVPILCPRSSETK